jgi:hypothetical protein
MDNLADTLFGPLGKDYCIYFYYLSVIGIILLTLLVASTLAVGITKRMGIGFYLQMLTVAVGYLIFYFQNRLLYSMCVGTV